MFPSPPSSTTQELLLNIYNRRLLLHPPLYYHPPPSASPTTTQTDATLDTYTTANGFDANVIMVLSVLLCALFCSLCLNSIIRCTIRCSTFINRNHSNNDGFESRRFSSATLVNIGGVTKKALKTFPTVSFSADLKPPGLDSGCVICLSEFAAGEKVRLLPNCNHGFHVRCIDKWLDSHSSCPTCRSCLFDTCHKIVGGCNQASSSEPPPQLGVNVAPLAREDMVHRSSDTS